MTPTSPLFPTIPAYVLLFMEEGELILGTEKTEQGRAIVTFLSPVDALIEAAQFSRLGQICSVERASGLNPKLFQDKDGIGYLTDVRLGWPAYNGCIMQRSKGALAGCSQLVHQSRCDQFAFEIETVILGEYSRHREHAGLYAWRETLSETQRWDSCHLLRLSEKAIESVGLVPHEMTHCIQLAMFDPEFEQWHFVPHTALS